jgi:AraC-like DNA-binding protein/mannose-6-phosphate isomerase-like protein (cupin superfamily)
MTQIPLSPNFNTPFKSGRLPVLLYAGQIRDEPNWSFPMHKHDDLSEIIYIAEGEGEFVIGDTKYIAGAGDILIYNRGVLHEEKSNPQKPLKTYFCGVGGLHLEGVEEGCIIPNHICPVIHADKYKHRVESYISNIFEEVNSQIMGFELISTHLLVSLIILITRIVKAYNVPEQTVAPPNSLGYQIKHFIDRNYTQNIPLQEIANQLYISPYYMSRIFRKEIGYSPINYIIQRRIGEAKKLLLTTDMTVQEIALKVGYENTNYFSMLFKKVVGMSPKKFRELNMSG